MFTIYSRAIFRILALYLQEPLKILEDIGEFK
jgi:hypothetical protein